jgi:hypothetical protein
MLQRNCSKRGALGLPLVLLLPGTMDLPLEVFIPLYGGREPESIGKI